MRGEGRSSAFGQTDAAGGWAERRGTNDDRRVPRWSAVIGRAGVGPDGGMHLSDGGTLGWGAAGAMHVYGRSHAWERERSRWAKHSACRKLWVHFLFIYAVSGYTRSESGMRSRTRSGDDGDGIYGSMLRVSCARVAKGRCAIR